MTTTFDSATLQTLADTAELEIESSRVEGGPVRRVTIWVVVDGHAVYVRSVRGSAGRWHRDLSANPHGAIHVAGRRIAVTATPVVDAETISRVSQALSRKYQSRWPGPLAAMLREEVLATTIRLDAA